MERIFQTPRRFKKGGWGVVFGGTLALCVLISRGVLGAPSLPESTPSFVEGLQAYENQDWDQAQQIFSQLLKKYPQNPVLLYNLGLAEYRRGKKGWALGFWRNAKTRGASLKGLDSAIRYGEGELGSSPGLGGFSFETFYGVLSGFPHLWWVLCLMSYWIFLWKWGTLCFREGKSPSRGSWGVFIWVPLWLVFSFFSGISVWELSRERGTVVEDSSLAHTGPSSTSPTLFELSLGEPLVVKSREGDWVQVETRGRGLGWVEEKNIHTY